MKLISSLTFFFISVSLVACPQFDLKDLVCENADGQTYGMEYVSLTGKQLRYKISGIETGFDLPLREQSAGVSLFHYCSGDDIITEEQFQGNFTRSSMFLENGSFRIIGTEIVTRCSGFGDNRSCQFSDFRSVEVKCSPKL